MEELLNYFPELSSLQKSQFRELGKLYQDWNSKINVISRKDMDSFYEKHVLHSLGIAKVIDFKEGTHILDIGTGGGFPGIPLAIMFPRVKFHLVDSIGKKIKVVEAVKHSLGLKNVRATHARAESVNEQFDFIVSRAVTRMDDFVVWTQGKIKKKGFNDLDNGILYLKGGDLKEELQNFKKVEIFNLKDYFQEDFFETKKVVYLK